MQFKTSLIASFAVMLALAASTAQAVCEAACTSIQGPEGRCNYQCTTACGQPAGAHRQRFLGALKSQYPQTPCTSVGATEITCIKTARFGSCGAQKWTCGKC
ncbi:hypothetical protein K457DRAFT_122432 [Linnemannia elongata AG-77]|uniref:Uncharacterized protein n=1 Tax=Linnemannia elongata AG-77 TaxID=1314771 RepID=A0A197KCA3_9FUNG|nr:hypothetical protein K457DRAFT_122432 [Linnemannia elongata AG-77]